jgi:ribosome-associated protein
MTGPLHVRGSVVVPEAELAWRFSRSSGPGGQGVNTTDSRVQLEWDPATSAALTEDQRARAVAALGSPYTVDASERRSQLRNRNAARERLVQALRSALAPPPLPRVPTKPSRGSRQRRLDAKKRRGQTKALRGRVTGD